MAGEAFVQSLGASAGVLCGAGFQTPSEALYLKKKLVVIPMKGQYEQQCNAAALKLLGIPVLQNLKPKQFKKIKAWIENGTALSIDFPDETEWLLEQIVANERNRKTEPKMREAAFSSISSFRDFVLRKIFNQLKA